MSGTWTQILIHRVLARLEGLDTKGPVIIKLGGKRSIHHPDRERNPAMQPC
uniref:Uncharacterized protein n=1 Tax=Arundo donax TaxID=35708 RepID=A0A0A9HHB5_ARUDO